MGASFDLRVGLVYADTKALQRAAKVLMVEHPLLDVSADEDTLSLAATASASTTLAHAAEVLPLLQKAAKKAVGGKADLVEHERALLLRTRPGRAAVEMPVWAPPTDALAHAEPVKKMAAWGSLLAIQGGWYAGGPRGGSVSLWDVSKKAPRFVSRLGEFSGVGDGVAFSNDGTRLVIAGGDGTLDVWDHAAERPICRAKYGQYKRLTALSFSPDDTRVLMHDGKAPAVYDATTGKRLHKIKKANRSADWLDDDRLLLCDYGTSKGTRLFTHRLSTGEEKDVKRVSELRGPRVRVSRDGKGVLLVASYTCAMLTPRLKLICETPNPSPMAYDGGWAGGRAICFSPPTFIVFAANGESAKRIEAEVPGVGTDPTCLSPDGKTAYVFADGVIHQVAVPRR